MKAASLPTATYVDDFFPTPEYLAKEMLAGMQREGVHEVWVQKYVRIDLRNELKIECRFHDLRHYNASIMLAMNIPDKYAMERMGYATAATLKKVYQHTMKGRRKEVSDMVNEHMDGLLGSDVDEKKDD